MTFGGRCMFCGQDVLDADHAAYRVTGWEFTRMGGGANQIRGRERVPDLIAHVACVQLKLSRARAGIADDQMELA
jgi:hypothetical protein